MASDLSSGCTDSIGGMYEKEEGEISLEDVSSSDEGNFNYVCGSRAAHCSTCLSYQHCASWCNASVKNYHHSSSGKKDVVQGKENRHYSKESGSIGPKHSTSTLQEKNDDLMPISSDSDMEIVGLTDSSKQILLHHPTRTKMKKKKKKKKNHGSTLNIGDLVSPSTVDMSVPVCILKQDSLAVKTDRLPKLRHREASPVHRNIKSKIGIKSPLRRNRVQIHGRSPLRKSRSPISRIRSPQIKRSPRRVRSPKRSPYRSLGKILYKKPSRCEHSSVPPSYNYNETHDNLDKLLRKVRQLDSVGISGEEINIKSKEHASSLKEKLSNMMKGSSDCTDVANSCSKEKQSNVHAQKNDADDEEDLALLRQKALETKQKKPVKVEQVTSKSEEKKATCYDEDHDEEDLELRMIALRSAVLKKHQDRVQRGVKSKKVTSPNNRAESPFTQSFLDSIPIPNEKLRNSVSPPHPLEDAINTEDMDLDTDVEMEKEKLPYSPTDNITTDIPLDTDMLSIQPSDVSFINVVKTKSNPHFDNDLKINLDCTAEIIKNKSFLPKTEVSYFDTNTDAPYSPSDSIEISKNYDACVSSCRLDNVHCVVKNESHNLDNTYNAMDIENEERPYSPTDAPVYDPDLSQTLPSQQTSYALNASCLMPIETSYDGNLCGSSHMPNLLENSQLQHVTKSPSVLTTNAITPLDQLATANSIVSPCMEGTPRSVEPQLELNSAQEPLYMQGIPDVTKDVNKIPTLINRTLVPVPILKSNKQLQQPLPIKKQESHTEATFKNADMQPVPIELNTDMNVSTHFKPIRLAPIAKKAQVVLNTVTVGFQNCSNDNMTNTVSDYREGFHNAIVTQANISTNSTTITTNATEFVSKRKRNRRRSGRRRAHNNTSSVNNKTFKDNKTNSITAPTTVIATAAATTAATATGTGTATDTDTVSTTTTAAATTTITTTNSNSNSNNNIKEIEKDMKTIQNQNVMLKQNECQSNEITTTCRGNSSNSVSPHINHPVATKSMQRSKSLSPSHGRELEDKSKLNASAEIEKTDSPSECKAPVTRRPSLDEDEEALRAILLASLAKRTKGSDTNSLNTPSVITSANGSNNDTMITKIQPSSASKKTTTASTSQTIMNVKEKHQENASNIILNNNTIVHNQQNINNEKLRSSLITNAVRKRSLSASKSPARKFMKKVSIPASTKVVNNAKKYQNTLVQRKLNLQKSVSHYKTENAIESKFIPVTSSNVKVNENKWLGNQATKTVMSSDMQRIVISLGSDTESDSEHERQKTNSVPPSNSNKVQKRQVLTIPTSEFEKSVDQFLKDVRKKQENAVANKQQSVPNLYNTSKKSALSTVPIENKNTTSVHTPLAVRHLSVSQQEEYRRLKQQIIEYEKLKLKRSAENAASKQDKKNKGVIERTRSSMVNNAAASLKEDQTKSQKLPTKLSCKENTLENTDVKKCAHISVTSPATENDIHVSNVVSKQNNDMSPKTASTFTKELPHMHDFQNNAKTITTEKTQTTNHIVAPSQEIEKSTPFVPSLRALTKKELDEKAIQIQVTQSESGRVVTINDNTNSSEKEESLQSLKQNGDKNVDNVIFDQVINSDKLYNSNFEKEVAETKINLVIDNIAELNALDITSSTDNQNVKNDEIIDSENKMNVTQLKDTVENQESCNLSSTGSDSNVDKLQLKSNKTNMEEFWETIRKDVKTELDSLINLPRFEQERHLMDAEHKLVMQRYIVLDDLAEMSENLRQWDTERDLQTNLVEEVKRLREQLRIAERKLQIHRNRINSMGPKVMVAHGKINEGRRECFKLTRICMVLGTKVIGQDYKLPEAGAHLLDNKVKEVANHTRQLSKKKVPSVNSSVSPVQSRRDLSPNNGANTNTELTQETCSVLMQDISRVAISTEDDLTSVDIGESLHQVEVKTEGESDLLNSECNVHETADSIVLVPEDNQNCVNKDVPSRKNDDVIEDRKMAETQETSNTLLKDVIKVETVEQHHNMRKPIEPYVSMLTHLKVPRNTNPNGVLCPYELMGTCNDRECQFVHQSAGQSF